MATDWKAQRAAATQMEMDAGRRQVHVSMATGVIEQMDKELGVKSKLIYAGIDPREWMVETTLPKGDITHVESFWDFPTNELKAKIMLLGGKYGNA